MEAVVRDSVSKIESIDYWQHHVNCYEKSGLTKAAYCRKNSVNTARFNYWSRKLQSKSHELVAVKVANTFPSSASETLCTVILDQHLEIKIHNSSILSFILDRFK
jgi:hypothetical protein